MKKDVSRGALFVSAAVPLFVGGTANAQVVERVAAQPATVSSESPFEAPVRVRGGDGFVKVEEPGYACPTLFDIDGDGKKDLVVGQFNGGKMRVYKARVGEAGRGTFGAGEWLMAGGKVAEVPGVW